MSEKAKTIIRNIAELYGLGVSEDEQKKAKDSIYKKLIARESEWEKAFEDYDEYDVIQAINNFWRFKSDKVRPSVAQILAMLQTEKEVTKKNTPDLPKERCFCIESDLMQRDMELGRNQQYILPHYRRAVNYILGDRLRDLIGEYEYKKLSRRDPVEERSEKYRLACQNGLFNDFDEILAYQK